MTDPHFIFYIFIFFSTFLLTALAEKLLIPKLSTEAKQPIYAEGPKWHMSKQGTPTMGGLAFLIALFISLSIAILYLLSADLEQEAKSLGICLIYAALNSLIGIWDDLKKLANKKNNGLTPTQKLLLQGVLAAGFLVARALILSESSILSFAGGDVDIGPIYYPLSFLVLIGITNCANLTDGIDGLASGVAFAIGVALFYISFALNYEVATVSAALMGAASAFLIFNLHPAKIFMGDTGSLLFGSLIASMGLSLGNPIIILFICGVYVIEGASVILQVIWYKLKRKRLFKMAPIHHHLEQSGWSENRICIVAIITTLLFSVPAFIFYMP